MAMKNDVGVIAPLRGEGPVFKEVADFGLKCCQLVSWQPERWTPAVAARVREESRTSGVRMTALWAGYSGKVVWNFVEGPQTLGLIPPEHRARRVGEQKRAADFAKGLGVPAIITHLGFIPENAADPVFAEVVAAVREVAEHCQKLGLEYWFETGQETPVTMLRLIQQVGTGNLGVNLDPANLILYGRGNPVDALDVFGAYVRNVHAKDGLYPTDPMKLGREVKVGEGRVRFPDLVRQLKTIGFAGEFIIEREIKGDQQRKDIAETVGYLRNLLATT
jgi:sugar phosphate isomerase/epimerase